jgi:hypothetical protein
MRVAIAPLPLCPRAVLLDAVSRLSMSPANNDLKKYWSSLRGTYFRVLSANKIVFHSVMFILEVLTKARQQNYYQWKQERNKTK